MITRTQTNQVAAAAKKAYKVSIRYVKNVSVHDYPQAKRAWDALVEAGIDPGELVSGGLSQGHGYQIEDLGLYQQFSVEAERELIQQNISSEASLVSYQYKTDQNSLLVLPESLENASISASVTRGMELVPVMEEVINTVEMVAVIPETNGFLNPPKMPLLDVKFDELK
jgi:hypothetical protein